MFIKQLTRQLKIAHKKRGLDIGRITLKMDINDNLIVSFRETVNSNSGFVFHSYHSQDGKNYWNIICSCMDWISVSIRFLSNNFQLNEDIDVRVMQFYSVISAIDIVQEAINQLHRVFFKNHGIPFSKNKEIFKRNKLGLDDNSYFKEIRAMFGAHPVNLTHHGNEKWYASWPYDHYKSEDSTFELRLYSNKVGIEDITFGVNINDLESFLIQRYEYLSVLEKEIGHQYVSFCKDLAAQPIKLKGSALDDILILETESERRINNDYYNGILYELKKVFTTTLIEKHLKDEEEEFKENLQKLIKELHDNLQKMCFTDLENNKYIDPDYSYSDIGYSVSKLFNYEFDRNREPLYDYHMKELDKYSNDRYEFKQTKNPDQVFLKLKMMLYRMNEEQNSS